PSAERHAGGLANPTASSRICTALSRTCRRSFGTGFRGRGEHGTGASRDALGNSRLYVSQLRLRSKGATGSGGFFDRGGRRCRERLVRDSGGRSDPRKTR